MFQFRNTDVFDYRVLPQIPVGNVTYHTVSITNSVFKIQKILDSKTNPITRFEAKELWSNTSIFEKSKVYIIACFPSIAFTSCNLL